MERALKQSYMWIKLPGVLALEHTIRMSAGIPLEDQGEGKKGRTQEDKSNCLLKWNFSAPLLCTLFLAALIDASVSWATGGLKHQAQSQDHVTVAEYT